MALGDLNATLETAWNYESKLKPLSQDILESTV